MAAQATDRNIQQLENIEQQIASAIQSAGQTLQELSKDKPSLKQVEGHCTSFIKSVDSMEDGLATHINYLTQCSTGQPHEGSCYAAQNDLHMSHFRWEHVRSRLTELEKMKNEHMRQQNLQRSMAQAKRGINAQQQQQQQQTQQQQLAQAQSATQPMETQNSGVQFMDQSSSGN